MDWVLPGPAPCSTSFVVRHTRRSATISKQPLHEYIATKLHQVSYSVDGVQTMAKSMKFWSKHNSNGDAPQYRTRLFPQGPRRINRQVQAPAKLIPSDEIRDVQWHLVNRRVEKGLAVCER